MLLPAKAILVGQQLPMDEQAKIWHSFVMETDPKGGRTFCKCVQKFCHLARSVKSAHNVNKAIRQSICQTSLSGISYSVLE